MVCADTPWDERALNLVIYLLGNVVENAIPIAFAE
jgi:hypothetical protein